MEEIYEFPKMTVKWSEKKKPEVGELYDSP